MSEAYFAVNDFSPYTRAQLAAHDPEGLALMERIWNLGASDLAAAFVQREDPRGAPVGSSNP